MLKILLLADKFHANTLNFIDALEKTSMVDLEVLTFDINKAEKNSKFHLIMRLVAFVSIFYKIRLNIIKFKPDIILGYRTTSYGYIATRFYKQAKIVVAMQGVSDIFPFDNWASPIKKRLQYNTFKRASLIQAWGKTQQKNALLNGADPNKLFVMPRGINLNYFKFGDQFANVETMNWVVSRSLSIDYNHDLLIGSFSKFIKNNNRKHHLYIAGEGQLFSKLLLLVSELKISDYVTFLGRISNNELSELLSKSHIYVSLPVSEGVSASLLEAMACGCIPIVTDLPSNREWIENQQNGILTKIDNEDIVVENFEYLFDNLDTFIDARIQNREIVELLGNQKINTQAFIDEYLKLI